MEVQQNGRCDACLLLHRVSKIGKKTIEYVRLCQESYSMDTLIYAVVRMLGINIFAILASIWCTSRGHGTISCM